jgi:hypothetical protein
MGSVCVVLDVSEVRISLVLRAIVKAKFLFRLFASRLITALPRLAPFTASLASRLGSTRRKTTAQVAAGHNKGVVVTAAIAVAVVVIAEAIVVLKIATDFSNSKIPIQTFPRRTEPCL